MYYSVMSSVSFVISLAVIGLAVWALVAAALRSSAISSLPAPRRDSGSLRLWPRSVLKRGHVLRSDVLRLADIDRLNRGTHLLSWSGALADAAFAQRPPTQRGGWRQEIGRENDARE